MPVVRNSRQVADNVYQGGGNYSTGGSFGGGDSFSTGGGFGLSDPTPGTVYAPYPPARPAAFSPNLPPPTPPPSNAAATTNLGPGTYGLGVASMQPPSLGAAPPPSPGANIPALYGAPAGTPGPAPPEQAPYPSASVTSPLGGYVPGLGGLSGPLPGPAAPPRFPLERFRTGEGGIFAPSQPTPQNPPQSPATVPLPPPHSAAIAARGTVPAALPPAGGGVPLPPPHAAALAARAAALSAPPNPNPAAPGAAPYPVARVQGPNFLRNFILAGRPPPGAAPTVGGTMASMLNRGVPYGGAGQGGGRD